VNKYQTGIIEDKTSSAMFMLFKLVDGNHLTTTLTELSQVVDGCSTVVGFGNKLMQYFPQVDIYQTHQFNSALMNDDAGCDLAIWLKNEDKGKLFHQATKLNKLLATSFTLEKTVSAYAYREKFDLSDFEDGIENPQGDEMLPVAIVAEGKLSGSSFWVLQQWLHDVDWLRSNDSVRKEACIGRSMDDSRQLDNLPDSAHIKKAAKENFTPEADLLRKSMPWSDDNLNGGLMFSCFSVSFRSFNLQMASMLGIDDTITDGVFNFSKILNTNYLWCPPIVDGRLDLSLFNAK
jgi:putative iron-dependent peroxidase